MKRWTIGLIALVFAISTAPVVGVAKGSNPKTVPKAERPAARGKSGVAKANKSATRRAENPQDVSGQQPKSNDNKPVSNKTKKGKGMTLEDRTQLRALKTELKQVHESVREQSKKNQRLASAIAEHVAATQAVYSPEVLESLTDKINELTAYVESYKSYLQDSRTELAKAKNAAETKDGARAVEAVSANLQIMKSRLALKQHINTVLNSIAELVGLGVTVTP